MATPTPTPALTLEDFFSTTLSSDITASSTVIPLNSVPASAEGFLVLEQDNGSREIIYYTSKGASTVTCPSAALGRGQGGTTAASHSSGATVKMNMVSQLFKALQSGDSNVGLAQRVNELTDGFPYVVSGGVWTGDSYGSTLLGSMTALICYINGRRISSFTNATAGVVTAHAFTASKDTYIDVLDNGDNTGTLVYTEVSNNAASPALASNSMRIAIVVTGGSSIASVASINQGQVGKLLPIASSVPYMVTDSLGNLIFNNSPTPRIIGYRKVTSGGSGGTTSYTGVATTPFIAPANRKVRVTGKVTFGEFNTTQANASNISVVDGGATTVATGAGHLEGQTNTNTTQPTANDVYSPATGLRTLTLSFNMSGGGQMSTWSEAMIIVELD